MRQLIVSDKIERTDEVGTGGNWQTVLNLNLDLPRGMWTVLVQALGTVENAQYQLSMNNEPLQPPFGSGTGNDWDVQPIGDLIKDVEGDRQHHFSLEAKGGRVLSRRLIAVAWLQAID